MNDIFEAMTVQPEIKTTVVGSYPTPKWLSDNPTEANLIKATKETLEVQQEAGLDLICDGEMYRFDPSHPETNGMIEYFIRPLNGVRMKLTKGEILEFRSQPGMEFRRLPAGIIDGPLEAGDLNLRAACDRVLGLTAKPLKFTLTGPHMLVKTIPNKYYKDLPGAAIALAEVMAAEVAKLQAEVVQIDEANLPGHPEEWEWALEAINIMLDAVPNKGAVHLCFGNYGGKRVQQGEWKNLSNYFNGLHADHVVLETKRRPESEIEVFKDLNPDIGLGLGVIDIKTKDVESASDVARDIERMVGVIGPNRLKYVHPDCGFWMLNKATTDEKIRQLVKGRDLFLGHTTD